MILEYAFFEGKIRPFGEAKISIATNAFQYGTGIFEGIRGYYEEKENLVFLVKPKEHFKRMLGSCKILKIEIPYSIEKLVELTRELVLKNRPQGNFYIRPIAYKSHQGIGPNLLGSSDFAIYLLPLGDYYDTKKGMNLTVSSWQRVSDNAIPPRGKICGAYVNSALAATEAKESGFDDAVILKEDGRVSEVSGGNIFILRSGKLITPPVFSGILEGITRGIVIELAQKELGIEVLEREIERSELYIADEIMVCGTGFQILGVVSIDKRTIGGGDIGPITKKLQDLYFEVVKGKLAKYKEWLEEIKLG